MAAKGFHQGPSPWKANRSFPTPLERALFYCVSLTLALQQAIAGSELLGTTKAAQVTLSSLPSMQFASSEVLKANHWRQSNR